MARLMSMLSRVAKISEERAATVISDAGGDIDGIKVEHKAKVVPNRTGEIDEATQAAVQKEVTALRMSPTIPTGIPKMKWLAGETEVKPKRGE